MSTRTRIEQLREEMRDADLEVLRVLERRARSATQIAKLLRDDPEAYQNRAPSDLSHIQQAATSDIPQDGLRTIFRAIHSVCTGLEGPWSVAVVGDSGDIGQVVARRMFGTAVQTSHFSTPAEAFDEVSRGRFQCALVPYETSTEGPVLGTILALRETQLFVTSQCEVPAGLALVGNAAEIKSVKKIYVTEQDHARTASFLQRDLVGIPIISTRTTELACQLAVEDPEGAAIAHLHVGQIHGLAPIIADVGTQRDLRIRFAVIGTRPASRTGDDLTSVIFTLQDEPGALLRVIDDFSSRDVNVKNIISRPVAGDGWDYVFYIDIKGHETDRPLIAALDEARKHTKTLRVIGSYPAQCQG